MKDLQDAKRMSCFLLPMEPLQHQEGLVANLCSCCLRIEKQVWAAFFH